MRITEKRVYTSPSAEVINLASEDILTASGFDGIPDTEGFGPSVEEEG